MSDPGPRDARTTPPWARVPVMIGLVALSWYFLACFHFAMDPATPRWTALGHWKMFTEISASHQLLVAEARYSGEWRELDLDALFPTWWDSGPRYARSSVRKSNGRMRVLADSACSRDAGGPERVRFTEISWPVIVGRYDQEPPGDARRKELLDWDCASEARRPKGVRW